MDQQRRSRFQPGFILSWLLLLASAYLLTYSATPQSTDTLRIFDAASSLARYGDIARDETIWIEAPQVFDTGLPYPIIDYERSEPLILIATAGLYMIADFVPGVGYAHVAWLLNIVVALGAALLFYCYARTLQYTSCVSMVGALLLGLGTGVWVYTTTLFREPMVMLWLLGCALAIERFRQRESRVGWGWLPLAALAFVLAYFTKNSVLFALPALLILALPQAVLIDAKRLRRAWDVVLLVAVGIFIASVFSQDIYRQVVALLHPLLDAMGAEAQYGRIALHTYLFSVGGSLWGTAPILLLALPGSWLLLHKGQRRIVWAVVAMIVGYGLGHALLTGVHWFGGLSWPPRFLIPVLPFAMLLVLPFLQYILREGVHVLLRAAVVLLAVYSVLIQFIGAISFFGTYVEYLPPEANGLYEWLPGLNTVQYLRWLILPQTWVSVGFDTAWARMGNVLFPLLFIMLLLLAVLLLTLGRGRRWMQWGAWIGWGALGILTFLGLQTLHNHDPLYWANQQELFEVLEVVEQQAADSEPLLLADNTYSRFIMNYYDLDNARPIVLGFQPGEAPSDVAPPRIISDYPPEMLELYAPRAIDFLAEHHERIWLLASNSEFLPWAVRPVERYLGENYYLIDETRTDDPGVRLLQYSTVRAPNRYEFRLAEETTNFTYGESIRLLGYTLPEGQTYAPGDVLPITFFWQTEEPLAQEYNIAWFVVPEDNSRPPIQGFDSRPDANFRSTLTWQPGEVIYDNRALLLPSETPVGDYVIWVLFYEAGSGGMERLAVTGGETLDDEIGILPVRIQVVTH